MNVSQTYMSISASVSSLALVGVAVSLIYQARAGRTAREQSIRTLQQQLIIMEMEDPALMTAMGAPWGLPIPSESARIREYLYIHMWASFWAGNYVVGELSATAVKKLARAELLNSNAGRTYWAAVRGNVLSTNEGKYLRFARIVDEEYQKLIRDDIRVPDPVKISNYLDEPADSRKNVISHLILTGLALAAGMLVGRKYGRMTNKRDGQFSSLLLHLTNKNSPGFRRES